MAIAKATPKPPTSAFGSMLGAIAIAIGGIALGYYMLDGHTHTCEACGRKWRHLGALNLGDPAAHTCAQCGTVQWWKDGMQHVFRSPLPAPLPTPDVAKWQQRALASGEPRR